MIYISHKLDEVFRIADRVTVLRDGEYIGTRLVAETKPHDLIRMMVGRALADLFPKESVEPGDELLRVEHLSLAADRRQGSRALRDISFTLRRGEIVGVAGLMGAGRTELLETLFGVYPRSRISGRILIEGREQHFSSPQDAIAAGMAFVTEDRKNQSLIVKLSVAENMTLAALKRFLSGGFHPSARRDPPRSSVRSNSCTSRRPAPLSMSTRFRAAISKRSRWPSACSREPRIFLLDEPTRGIDVGAKAEIYALVSHLAQEGAAILMASSELPEILAMCDRVLVLCEGELTGELTRAEATQERIMEAATARYQVRFPHNLPFCKNRVRTMEQAGTVQPKYQSERSSRFWSTVLRFQSYFGLIAILFFRRWFRPCATGTTSFSTPTTCSTSCALLPRTASLPSA